jgi:hypothetical protein
MDPYAMNPYTSVSTHSPGFDFVLVALSTKDECVGAGGGAALMSEDALGKV